MSCTVMYQPYAMTQYSSSTYEKSHQEKKIFKLSTPQSPADSFHSDTSYNSPGPSSSSNQSHTYYHKQPQLPSKRYLESLNNSTSETSSSVSPITSKRHTPLPLSIEPESNRSRKLLNSTESLSHSLCSSSSSSGTTLSHPHHLQQQHQQQQSEHETQQSQQHSSSSSYSIGGESHNTTIHDLNLNNPSRKRAYYVSENAIVNLGYDGEVSQAVDEHFTKSLSKFTEGETSSPIKNLPMSKRNFPLSFWDPNYYQKKSSSSSSSSTYPSTSASAKDYYSNAIGVNYGPPPIPGLSDPWHYSLPTHHHHHNYHNRHADIHYPSLSSSRFNPLQYGNFLFPGPSGANSTPSRFSGIGPPGSQCNLVKGVGAQETPVWPNTRYHYNHDSISELQTIADYNAAAAAHYSMTAATGLEPTHSNKDYWFS